MGSARTSKSPLGQLRVNENRSGESKPRGVELRNPHQPADCQREGRFQTWNFFLIQGFHFVLIKKCSTISMLIQLDGLRVAGPFCNVKAMGSRQSQRGRSGTC